MRIEGVSRRGFEDLGECVARELVKGTREEFVCVDLSAREGDQGLGGQERRGGWVYMHRNEREWAHDGVRVAMSSRASCLSFIQSRKMLPEVPYPETYAITVEEVVRQRRREEDSRG